GRRRRAGHPLPVRAHGLFRLRPRGFVRRAPRVQPHRHDARLLGEALRTLNARGVLCEVWPLETDDIEYGLRLRYKFPDVDHATLIKLAACWRRNVDEIETFDPSLRRAIDAGARGTRLTALDLAV